MIFQHLRRLFLPDMLKYVPCSLNELLFILREESIVSGIGRFRRLEIPTDGQLAQFRFCSKSVELYITGRPVPLDSSRRLTNSPLRGGFFFYIPGRKACEGVENSCFDFVYHKGCVF